MWLWSPESHLVSTGKSNSTAHVAVTHTEVVFSSFLCLPTFTLPIFFFGAKCFHFGLLWCAEMINRLMTLRLPEENKNYRPEDTGNVTIIQSCWVTNCTLFLMLPPTFDNILKHCTKLAEWTHGMFVFFFFLNEQSSNLSPSLNPFCL